MKAYRVAFVLGDALCIIALFLLIFKGIKTPACIVLGLLIINGLVTSSIYDSIKNDGTTIADYLPNFMANGMPVETLNVGFIIGILSLISLILTVRFNFNIITIIAVVYEMISCSVNLISTYTDGTE